MSTSETPPGATESAEPAADEPTGPSGPPEPSELVGALLAGRFTPTRLVVDGANAAVFDAEDEQAGRAVTLKLIRSSLAASPSFRRRFDETMRSVAALTHANIAAVYDWGVTPVGETSTAYVVIEQLTGGSLRDMFDRGRQLSPSQALAVGLDACRALDYAHRRGLVHGELTPSKLVFGDDRRLRIIDFGLSNLLGELAWAEPESVPTHVAWYASPEQGTSQEIDGKTDVYALCLSLHEAVTGTLPFRHDSTVASLAARVGKLMPVSADLGPLAAVFEYAGRPSAEERASAAEFGKGLVAAAAKLPRPEPLLILSTGLFDTPAEQMRSPEDPTGGVVRPGDDGSAADRVPEAPTIVEAEPDLDIPTVAPGDDLVILPLDSGIGGSPGDAVPAPAAAATGDVLTDAPSNAIDETTNALPDAAVAPATQVMPVAAPPPKRRRRGFPWKILLSILVVAALAVLGVLAMRLFETPVYTVPDVVEMPEAEARNLIATNGWIVTTERERSDQVPVVGQVVRTAPQAGVDLAEGEPFLIVVSEGPTLRELPDSTARSVGEAQTRLVERGLRVELVEVFDEDIPSGIVISWSVPGDPTLTTSSFVEPLTPVELVVSQGPEPRVVPDVRNVPVGEARSTVEALRLVFSEAEQVFSDDVELGRVVSQSVEPGTEIARDSEVTVVVSKGPDLVTFPDLAGAANFEEAAQILIQAGFEPRLVFGDTLGELRSFTIEGRQPDVGETFRRGTEVDVEAL
ncbi:MAG: PASTA domain-containing protein [Ilumatobacter sp.]|uniref:PASTA domain-containing protein n=1 Tax=Ilumatobacter sp. TaxID=1967498 RepID=UPI00263895B9|nr:PASTA domain-containing protein [Ilumatobacter sp.]MDJ0769328.1 PASTA domain-containing protein [Ilumatobacter sp.]